MIDYTAYHRYQIICSSTFRQQLKDRARLSLLSGNANKHTFAFDNKIARVPMCYLARKFILLNSLNRNYFIWSNIDVMPLTYSWCSAPRVHKPNVNTANIHYFWRIGFELPFLESSEVIYKGGKHVTNWLIKDMVYINSVNNCSIAFVSFYLVSVYS